MREWLLHSSSMAQWHALIGEAQRASHVQLEEELESYLVFLLMRFIQEPTFAHSVMAMDFLQACQHSGQQRHQRLKSVGDKSLLIAGLFPERAKHRRVELSYFVELGRSAYDCLGEEDKVFQSVSDRFVALMDVLQATRPQASASFLQNPQGWVDEQTREAQQGIFLNHSVEFRPRRNH